MNVGTDEVVRRILEGGGIDTRDTGLVDSATRLPGVPQVKDDVFESKVVEEATAASVGVTTLDTFHISHP